MRYIANRSSGKQGHAVAAALARLGAEVHLVSGPVGIADPPGVDVTHVQTAREMRDAVEALLPADAAIFAAAVADWRAETEAGEKLKKVGGKGPDMLPLTENPDILAGVGKRKQGRPALVIGFAAETEKLIEHGQAKLDRKGADFIVANDVSPDSGIGGDGVMGGDRNRITLLSDQGAEEWPDLSKDEVAERLARLIATRLAR